MKPPVVLFTHNDLDGAGCAALAKEYLAPDVVPEVLFCSYGDIDALVAKKLVEVAYVGVFLFTDISPSLDTAENLDRLSGGDSDFLVSLCDHHSTAKAKLSKFPWATFGSDDICATEMVQMQYRLCCGAREFAFAVGAWDCHRTESPDYTEGKRMNALCQVMGPRLFSERGPVCLNNSETLIASAVVQAREERMRKYADQAVGFTDLQGRHGALVVTPEVATVDMGELLGPRYDYVCIVDTFRWEGALTTVRDDLDVSEIAKTLGGGGHPKAAGFRLGHLKGGIVSTVFNLIGGSKIE